MFKQSKIKLDSREIPLLEPWVSKVFSALPGKVIVQMMPPKEEMSGFQLPDTIGAKYRANIGAVIAAGGARNKSEENTRPDLWLGFNDGVLCRPYDGEWFDDLEIGDFKASSRIIFFGVHGQAPLEDILALAEKRTPQTTGDTGLWHPVPWWESVVAKFVGKQIFPTGDNVLIRRHKKRYAVVAVDEDWEEMVEVVRAGPFMDIKPGPALVKCDYQDLLELEFKDDDSLAIVPASTVHAYA